MKINPKRTYRYATGAWVLVLATAWLTMSPNVLAQEEFRETYNAVALVMGTSNPPIAPPGTRATIQITVTRWTTDEERAQLFTELIENGQEGLVEAMQKQEETGRIRNTSGRSMSGFPSERLKYARQFNLPDGTRRVVLAMDRPISFAEAVYRPRWSDYDMTLIVLDLDKEGKGEGQLAMGVKLSVDTEKKELVIENFGSEPVRLMNVRQSK